MAVAGKRSQMDYRTPIWGGQAIKRLGVDGSNYFVVPMTLPGVNSKADLINYNEHGVITFVEGVDGMRIREAVLTTQPGNTEQESEEAIVSILHMVKVNVWEVAKEFQGRTITASYKTDLEQNISSRLDQMKQDDALVDISEEDLKAYDVQVTVLPRSNQIKGIVTIKVTVTPVHAARQIVATIYVN
jgi:hypothetical protein